MVLRGVEHLEQRGRRVTAPVGAELVDLVEDDDGVHRARLAQRAHDPARTGADVGTPVTAHFGLIAYTTERHPAELAAERACDRFTQ